MMVVHLHTKNAFALIRLHFAFFYAAFTGLFDLFFFLDKKEPKNQERNMLSTLFV
jgi:hypothetical protein